MGLGSWRRLSDCWRRRRRRRGCEKRRRALLLMLKDHHSSVSRSRRNRCLSDGDSAGRFRAIAAVHIRLRCHDRTQVFRNNFCWRQLVWIQPLRNARDKHRTHLQNWPQCRVQSRVERCQVDISEHLLWLGNELARGAKIVAPAKSISSRGLSDDAIDAYRIKP